MSVNFNTKNLADNIHWAFATPEGRTRIGEGVLITSGMIAAATLPYVGFHMWMYSNSPSKVLEALDLAQKVTLVCIPFVTASVVFLSIPSGRTESSSTRFERMTHLCIKYAEKLDKLRFLDFAKQTSKSKIEELKQQKEKASPQEIEKIDRTIKGLQELIETSDKMQSEALQDIQNKREVA